MIHTSIDDINPSPDAVEKAVTARRWIKKEEKHWQSCIQRRVIHLGTRHMQGLIRRMTGDGSSGEGSGKGRGWSRRIRSGNKSL
jgi:hypothetical protein